MRQYSAISITAADAAALRRRALLRRVKLSPSTTELMVGLAFPADQDRADRQPAMSHFSMEAARG